MDWAVGTEPQVSEIKKTRFAGYAVKATCLAPEEGGGRKGGVVHFYPQQWEKGSKVQWREVMKGRILVAQVELDKPTWIVGAYSPHEGDKRSEFWQKIK